MITAEQVMEQAILLGDGVEGGRSPFSWLFANAPWRT